MLTIGIALLALISLGGCSHTVATTPAPVLPPGAQAPPAQFLKDYAYMALSADVAKKQDALAKTSELKQM